MRELTVYADVHDAALLRRVECAARRAPAAQVRVVTRASLLAAHAHSTVSLSSSLLFVREWERDKGDAARAVAAAAAAADNTTRGDRDACAAALLLQRHECFVSDTLRLRDGAVTYALYARHMPVLALADTRHAHDDKDGSDGGGSGGSSGSAADDVSAGTSPGGVDAVRTLLYHTPRCCGCPCRCTCCTHHNRDDDGSSGSNNTRPADDGDAAVHLTRAIDSFFAHMTAMWATDAAPAHGRVVSVEFVRTLAAPHATLSHALQRDEATCAEACAVACAASASATASSSRVACACVPRVALLASDGYPLQVYGTHGNAWLSHTHNSGGDNDVAARRVDVLRPASRFDAVLRTLAVHSSGDKTTTATVAVDASSRSQAQQQEEHERQAQQRQSVVHVPGALTVLNRYEHRGLLRYLLLCGCTVVFVDHAVTTASRYADVAATATAARQSHSAAAADEQEHDHVNKMCVGSSSSKSDDADGATVAASSSSSSLLALMRVLVRFERHWLDMPLPQYTLCVEQQQQQQHDEEQKTTSSPQALLLLRQCCDALLHAYATSDTQTTHDDAAQTIAGGTADADIASATLQHCHVDTLAVALTRLLAVDQYDDAH